MKRYSSILNGGSIAGLVAFVFFLIVYYLLGMNPFGGIKFLGLAIPAAFMYFSVRRYRETEGEGFLKYGKGFMVGVMFTFIYSSLSAMLVYLYGLTIDGSFVEFFVNENLNAIGQAKDQLIDFIGKDAYQEMIDEFKKIDVGSLAFSDFQSKTMGGVIIALIIAAILRQNPPIFDDNNDEAAA
jgi:hypothetical protein